MPRKFNWTPERVQKFWTAVSSSPLADIGFSRQAGRQLFELIKPYLPEKGAIIDYGAGPGYFSRILLDAGYRVGIYEPSGSLPSDLVEDSRVSILTSGEMNAEFDALVCLETIEHILDEEFDDFLDRINGFLRPGGVLILSTPNDEDLARSAVYCVDADAFFHPWQHVRSFTVTKLISLLEESGFHKRAVGLADFSCDTDVQTEVRALRSQISGLMALMRRISEGEGKDDDVNTLAVQLEQFWREHWSDVSRQLSSFVQPIFNHVNDIVRRHSELIAAGLQAQTVAAPVPNTSEPLALFSIHLREAIRQVVENSDLTHGSLAPSIGVFSAILNEIIQHPSDRRLEEAIRLVSSALDEVIQHLFEEQLERSERRAARSAVDRIRVTLTSLNDVAELVVKSADELIKTLHTDQPNAAGIADSVRPIINHVNEIMRRYTETTADNDLLNDGNDTALSTKSMAKSVPTFIQRISAQLGTEDKVAQMAYIRLTSGVLTELTRPSANQDKQAVDLISAILNELIQRFADRQNQSSAIRVWTSSSERANAAIQSLAEMATLVGEASKELIDTLQTNGAALRLADGFGKRTPNRFRMAPTDPVPPMDQIADREILDLIVKAYAELLHRRGELYDESEMGKRGLDFLFGSGQTIVYIGEKVGAVSQPDVGQSGRSRKQGKGEPAKKIGASRESVSVSKSQGRHNN
jgi:2-polyprenyl-3-methyl-5-hydroxy-6-metoxy-1,4-benzoquinol methylase